MTDDAMTEAPWDWTSDGVDEGTSRWFYGGTPPEGDAEQEAASSAVSD